MKKEKRESYFASRLQTREENEDIYIEGYFAVFEQPTKLWGKCFEKIAREAFDKSLKENDIRCLFNHDHGFVLGRNINNTLELKTDAHGLYGKVKINKDDSNAMDAYARVKRGDISGCSFGFYPVNEEYEEKEDGSIIWTVKEADTFEVSICTFPAYPQTEIQARQKYFEETRNLKLRERKAEIIKKLEGIKC